MGVCVSIIQAGRKHAFIAPFTNNKYLLLHCTERSTLQKKKWLKNCTRKSLQSYLCLLSVPRSQYGRKCLRISTANRYQPLSVYDWDAAKALRVD